MASSEPEVLEIGDATRAIDDPVRFSRLFGALVSKDNAELFAGCLDSFDSNTCADLEPDPLALRPKPGNRIGIHRRQ